MLIIIILLLVLVSIIAVCINGGIYGGALDGDELARAEKLKRAINYMELQDQKLFGELIRFVSAAKSVYIFPEIFAFIRNENEYLCEPSQLYYLFIIYHKNQYMKVSDTYTDLYSKYKPILDGSSIINSKQNVTKEIANDIIKEVLLNHDHSLNCDAFAEQRDATFVNQLQTEYPLIWVYVLIQEKKIDEAYQFIKLLYNQIGDRIAKIPEGRNIMLLRDIYSNHATRNYQFRLSEFKITYRSFYISVMYYYLVKNMSDDDLFNFGENIQLFKFGNFEEHPNISKRPIVENIPSLDKELSMDSMHARCMISPLIKIALMRIGNDLCHAKVYDTLIEKSIITQNRYIFQKIVNYEHYRNYEITKLKLEIPMDFIMRGKFESIRLPSSSSVDEDARKKFYVDIELNSGLYPCIFEYYRINSFFNYEYCFTKPCNFNNLLDNSIDDTIVKCVKYDNLTEIGKAKHKENIIIAIENTINNLMSDQIERDTQFVNNYIYEIYNFKLLEQFLFNIGKSVDYFQKFYREVDYQCFYNVDLINLLKTPVLDACIILNYIPFKPESDELMDVIIYVIERVININKINLQDPDHFKSLFTKHVISEMVPVNNIDPILKKIL